MTPDEFAQQAAIAAVLRIHARRIYDGDGYGWSICVEDRQHWPCATVQALEDALRMDHIHIAAMVERGDGDCDCRCHLVIQPDLVPCPRCEHADDEAEAKPGVVDLMENLERSIAAAKETASRDARREGSLVPGPDAGESASGGAPVAKVVGRPEPGDQDNRLGVSLG